MPETSIIGQTLAGRFRITGVIGEGGMATVYRALDKSSKAFAVKVMNPELAQESRFVRRFRREAKAAALLKHPNTVQITEFGVDEKERVFMVMELLEGYDLAMLLHRERRIPEARAVQIVIQVCRALSAAHEQSIIHRDLKPDNIMLVRKPDGSPTPVPGMSPTDFVKVLDFGIAKILDDEGGAQLDPRADPITQEKSMLTRVGTIVGTPAYMAPEQGRAEAVDARTDLYACGVLLYELITGRVPFTGETPMQVVMRHVNEAPRPPSDHLPVTPALERIIMRALAKYAAERQQSAEELAFDLLGILPQLVKPPGKENSLANVNKTLVIEPSVPPPPGPKPAAGASAPRPAAGAPPPTRSGPSKPPQPPQKPEQPRKPERPHPPPQVANPFPTLNIEVPDDIVPASALVGKAGAAVSSSQAATEREHPRHDPLLSTAVSQVDEVASGSAAKSLNIPVLKPGQAQPGAPSAKLSSTLASALQLASEEEEEEEAPTMLKAPPMDKARMSLAEEAMAKALAEPNQAPLALSGLETVEAPDSSQPTLVTTLPAGAQAKYPKPPKPPKRTPSTSAMAPQAPAGPAKVELSGLEATMRVDIGDHEEAMLPAGPIAAPAPRAEQSRSPIPAVGMEAELPSRKPTAELAAVAIQLPGDERPSLKPDLASAALWQPKKKAQGLKLSGALALVIGIGIGALLVAAALTVAILVRGP